jgi:predicted ABC-type exoprotein transport system permease subunit
MYLFLHFSFPLFYHYIHILFLRFFLFLCFQFLRSKQALNMSTKRHKKIIVNMLEDTKLIIIFSFLMGSHVK